MRQKRASQLPTGSQKGERATLFCMQLLLLLLRAHFLTVARSVLLVLHCGQSPTWGRPQGQEELTDGVITRGQVQKEMQRRPRHQSAKLHPITSQRTTTLALQQKQQQQLRTPITHQQQQDNASVNNPIEGMTGHCCCCCTSLLLPHINCCCCCCCCLLHTAAAPPSLLS